MNRITAVVVGALLLASPPLSRSTWSQPPTVPADAPGATPSPGGVTVTDIVDRELASSFQISPDGTRVVWVKSTADRKKNGRRTHIYITRVADHSSRALTRGPHRDASPRFSPDGTRVAFLGSRGKSAKTQVWILHLSGGEPFDATRHAQGIRAFEWLDDQSIVFTAREDSTRYEKELTRSKDDVVVVSDGDHYTPVRLFRRNLKEETTRRLTKNAGQITSFSVSPNSARIVMSVNVDVDYRYNNKIPPRQYIYSVDTGELKEICASPHVNPYDFKWTADSDGFFCARNVSSDSTDTYVSISVLHYYDLSTGRLARVPTGSTRELGYDFYPVRGGILVGLANGVTDRLVELSGNPRRPKVRTVKTARTTRILAANPGGRNVVIAQSTASTVPDIRIARLDNGRFRDERPLVTLNKTLRKKKLARREIVRWAGAGGDSVEGILYYPLDWDASRKYACVASIHGGPSSRDTDYFSDRVSTYPHILAARGAFVFKVNYHGSSGYGLRWVESIKSRYYELEVPDILLGLDALEARGLIDPEQVGIMGWSNGSILSIASCIEDARFKVLCAGAGDVNWTSDYGNCAFGAGFDEAYFGGTPWDSLAHYIRKSPVFRMHKLKTPTLIMFGEKDTSVPTEQGWQHFRTMQRQGLAPVRFLLFPGAGHGLRKRSHQIRKMTEELAWIDTHLFNRPPPIDKVLDGASHLAMELKKAECARVGFLYGREVDASLVPETVARGELNVGRFEVTNAQFAAFDPNYSYRPGTENLPITGISLPLAQAYCMWLGEKTGARYRLPTEKEMEDLLQGVSPAGQNTLNRWLGGVPSPDELLRIEKKVHTLEATRSLLEPVGSFAPSDGVYDLNGNAAEWVVGENGEGLIRGACASILVDKRSGTKRPPLSYVSFRVILE